MLYKCYSDTEIVLKISTYVCYILYSIYLKFYEPFSHLCILKIMYCTNYSNNYKVFKNIKVFNVFVLDVVVQLAKDYVI